MQRAERRAALELVLLALLSSCHDAERHTEPSSIASSSARELAQAPRVRDAGRFDCIDLGSTGAECRQPHPHLPDTGEWRCAESEDGVWCAGGEPAAGVVPGAPDADFVCGPRLGSKTGERVCIDRHPAYPGDAKDYRCNFEQERGMTRVCRRTSPHRATSPSNAQRSPACWLDRDCPAGRCRAGACEVAP